MVILKTVSSIGELLHSFDVDCAAVCYEVGANRAWITARAKRAFEFKCNVVDMRFDHKTYPRKYFYNISYEVDYVKTGTSIDYANTLKGVSPSQYQDSTIYSSTNIS